MPYYEVNHTILLTESQKQDLATSITDLHSTRFTTPRMFVNVKFTDISNTPFWIRSTINKHATTDHVVHKHPSSNLPLTQILQTTDIAGKKRTRSHILAHVRTGPSRTNKDFNALCTDLFTAWESIVPLPKIKRSAPDEDRALYSVFVLGDIEAGMEAGFAIPEAGKDGEWLAENMGAFKARAEEGDEDFKDLVKEVEERGMLNGKKSQAQQLEEMMGWGDSA